MEAIVGSAVTLFVAFTGLFVQGLRRQIAVRTAEKRITA